MGRFVILAGGKISILEWMDPWKTTLNSLWRIKQVPKQVKASIRTGTHKGHWGWIAGEAETWTCLFWPKSGYDTTWDLGLLLELSGVVPRWIVMVTELMPWDRCFQVAPGQKINTNRFQIIDFCWTQCWHLLYLTYSPMTSWTPFSRQGIYDDKSCLASMNLSFQKAEGTHVLWPSLCQ